MRLTGSAGSTNTRPLRNGSTACCVRAGLHRTRLWECGENGRRRAGGRSRGPALQPGSRWNSRRHEDTRRTSDIRRQQRWLKKSRRQCTDVTEGASQSGRPESTADGSEVTPVEEERRGQEEHGRDYLHHPAAEMSTPDAAGTPGAPGEGDGGPPSQAPNLTSNRRLQQTQAQVDEVVDIMRVNVDKVLERDQKLSELDDRADALQAGASQFESSAAKLKNKYWWKNCKMMIIMAVVGVIFVGVIFLYFFY
ncbi:uncharacterized protein LOC114449909 [Parambassis ranga]|uniref:Uncharacterized protein LOC114449909 n=1 Tax=Parambassis ranga TaxID=210632 RepID=A0A6P7K2Q9_9TELE|nr:uncharacterized protein LOC114449909 [Parambassis ranga]